MKIFIFDRWNNGYHEGYTHADDSVKQYRKCGCKVLQYYCNIVFTESWARIGSYTVNESGSQERENWFGTWCYREIQR
jgi:hypothetical protein